MECSRKKGTIILNLLYAVLAIGFFVGMAAWLPIKICAIVAEIFTFIQSLAWSQMAKLYDQYKENFDISLIEEAERISSYHDIFANLASLLFVACFVLIIIWLNKKPLVPSIKNQPIDLI